MKNLQKRKGKKVEIWTRLRRKRGRNQAPPRQNAMSARAFVCLETTKCGDFWLDRSCALDVLWMADSGSKSPLNF
jgi:hypothetical protein